MVDENTHAKQCVRDDTDVPSSLRLWFILHFAADVIVALPIFLAPREVLGFFGWVSVDPMATRLAAAALFGIGIESLLGRNAGPEAFKGMLQLKLIWSAFATVGLAWSVAEGSLLNPMIGWLLVGVFAAFHGLWWYWLLRLNNRRKQVQF